MSVAIAKVLYLVFFCSTFAYQINTVMASMRSVYLQAYHLHALHLPERSDFVLNITAKFGV